jgi:hypothetical protein
VKRVLAALILVLAAGGGMALKAVPASAATPTFCAATGPIPATTISSPLDLSKCPIQGRQLVLPVGNASTAGIPVPPPGQSITNDTLTKSGEYQLTAANFNGHLTVNESSVVGSATKSANASAAADPACSETAYNYERYGTTGPPYNWGAQTLDWYYNESTASRAGLTVAATESDIRGANTNMTTGVNDCGYATGQFRSHGAFQGNTSKYANIDSSGNCTSNFPDLQNTVSWGPFSGTALSNGTLAVTCVDAYVTTGKMIEADIYIGSNVGIVDTLPSGCFASYDLQGTVTHEWGHAFGMAHESSGPAETMYPYEPSCSTSWRTLGNGDWHGMDNLYP